MRSAILLALSTVIAVAAHAQTPAPATPAPTTPPATTEAAPAPASPAAAAPATAAPHAAAHPRMTEAQRFAAANTSHDGHLTEAQAKKGLPVVYRHFQDIDSTHKGYVTLADIRTYNHAQYVKRAAARKAKTATPAAATSPTTAGQE